MSTVPETVEPSADEVAIGTFMHFAEQDDGEKALEIVTLSPVLLWPERWPGIADFIDGEDADVRDLLRSRLQMLQDFQSSNGGKTDFIPGAGPFQAILADLGDETLTEAAALRLCAAANFRHSLSPAYVEAASRTAFRSAVAGDFRISTLAFRLIFAALDALAAERAWHAAIRRTTMDFVNATSVNCNAMPDGRWLADAVRRGEAVLSGAAGRCAARELGDLLHALGIANLDPYFAGRSSDGIAASLRVWGNRLEAEYGVLLTAEKGFAMPGPLAAIETSLGYLNRALPLRSGLERGYTQKAIAEALMWRGKLGGEPAGQVAIDAAQEALRLISPQEDPTRVASLRQTLRVLGAGGDDAAPESFEDLIGADPHALIARHGELMVFERYAHTIAAMVDQPRKSAALVSAIWPLLAGPKHETERVAVSRQLIEAAFRWTKQYGFVPADMDRLREAGIEIARRGQRESWDALQTALMLAGVAVSTTSQDREADGLPLMEQAVRVAAEAGLAWTEGLEIQRAMMMLGAAVNAYNSGNMEEAAETYSLTLYNLARLGLSGPALNVVDRLQDVAFNAGEREMWIMALGLAQSGPLLTAREQPGVSDKLSQLWRVVFGRCFQEGANNPEVLALAYQAAKGGIFALLARTGETGGWRDDPEALALIERIRPLAKLDPATVDPDPSLDDDDLLCGFASRVAKEATGDAATLARLEQRFDALARGRVADTSGNPLETILRFDDLQDCLDPATVLLTHFAGSAADGSSALFTLLISRDSGHGAVGILPFPGGEVMMSGENREVRLMPLAVMVAELRRKLRYDPGPADVDSEAADLLEADLSLLGGGLAEQLAALRAAGKDHLCINPHGPFHFHPMHLIGKDGRCLADDWTVTKIPHLSLLDRRRGARAARAGLVPVAAFGMGFAGKEHGLPPLPGAPGEASEIARLMEGSAYTDARATEAAFMEALGRARRIHVATHGSHRVGAPSFQRVFLTPDGADDGIVHAYEMLGLDLRHVEMVTLSACETALGRFDASDNLMGFPANLLAAGVGCVVSALWPVPDKVASSFFRTLYATVADGRPPLAAYRAAQVATRAAFPAYRDWGAFEYTGTW